MASACFVTHLSREAIETRNKIDDLSFNKYVYVA